MTVVGEAFVRIRADGQGFAKETRASVAPGLAGAEADAKTAGLRAGEGMGSEFTRGADGKLRDARGRFVSAGNDMGAALSGGVGGGARAGASAVEQSGGRMRKDLQASESSVGRFSVFSRKSMKEAGTAFTEPLGGLSLLKMGTAGVAVAAAAIAGESVKMAGNFQQSMELLVTAGGEAQSNLGMISKGVLQMARDTGTSTDQLAEGMYTVEKAGFRGANGLNVLRVSAEAARAENVDLATMTNAVTSAMRSYNIPASGAVRVTNEMVAASGAAKTTMAEFAGSLSTVLPVASAAHLSFAQVGGAIATMTGHGTSAQEATQELSNTIRALEAPNHVAIAEMQQLGINTNDLSTKLGKRGLTGTLDLVTQKIASQMGPAGTVLMNSFNVSKSAGQDLQIMLDKMPPSLRTLAEGYQKGTVSVGDWRKAVKALPGDQAGMASQFVSLSNKANGFNTLLRSGSPAAQTYTAALKAIMGGATGMNTALMLTGSNMPTFKAKVAAIGDASRKTGKDISTWHQTQALFNVQWSRFVQYIETGAIALGTKLLPYVTDAMKGIESLGGIVGHAATIVRGAWSSMFSGGGGKGGDTSGLTSEMSNIVKIAQHMGQVLSTVWTGELSVARTEWNGVAKVIRTVVNTIRGYLTSHASQVRATERTVASVLHQLANTWSAIFAVIRKVVQIATGIILSLWDRWGQHLLQHLHTYLNAILEVIRGIFQIIQGVFNVVLGILTGKWSRAWNGIKQIAAGIWHIIAGIVKSGINTVSYIIGAAMAVISLAWSLAWKALKKSFDLIWGGIEDSASSVWDTIKGYFVSGVNDVIGIVNDFIGLLNHIPGVHIGKIGLISTGGGKGGGFGSSPAGGGAAGPGGGAAGGVVGYANGGLPTIVPGAGPHDTRIIKVRGGEGILVPEATAGLGGAAGIRAINALFAGPRKGGGSGGNGFSLGGTIWNGVKGAASTVASGVGDVVSILTNPGKAISGLMGGLSTAGKLVGGLGSEAMHSMVSSAMKMFGGGGAKFTGSGNVKQWILQALGLMHMSSAFLPGISNIIAHESGGNPNAINNTDINAQRGDPSRGLMQTIMSTFQAYVLPSLRALGIYNPIANITAGVRYALADYGPSMLMSGGNRSAGGGYAPYDSGGWLSPGITHALNGTGRREAVMPEDVMVAAIRKSQNPAELLKALDEQTDYLASIRDLIAAGGGSGSYHGVTA